MKTPTPPPLKGDYPAEVRISYHEGWKAGYRTGHRDGRRDAYARAGAKGGAAKSDAKTAAARLNASKPRPGRRKQTPAG